MEGRVEEARMREVVAVRRAAIGDVGMGNGRAKEKV